MALARVSFFMNTDHISKNTQKKQQIVAELTDKVQKAKAIIFTNYQGLTHQQIENFKKTLRELEAEYVVTKNRLIIRALSGKVDEQTQKEKFNQPTATLFLYNEIAEPLKKLARIIKELNLPTVKFGLLEGSIITDEQVAKIATLPPLAVLRAQALGQMKAPIQGLHRALHWNLQTLVLTLKAIEKKKV